MIFIPPLLNCEGEDKANSHTLHQLLYFSNVAFDYSLSTVSDSPFNQLRSNSHVDIGVFQSVPLYLIRGWKQAQGAEVNMHSFTLLSMLQEIMMHH